MGYTHNKGFSATESGYAIGVRGSEVPIFSGSTYATSHINVGSIPAETATLQVDGSGYAATSSRAFAIAAAADSGSTNLNGDYYVGAIRGNFILGTTSANASICAVLGMLNTYNKNFGSGDHYAVRGHLDFWGSSTLAGANNNTGAVSAYVQNEATTTVSAGNILCGLQVYQVGGATLASGVYPAGGLNPGIWLRATSGAAWQTGVYMPVNSVKTGIRIGNWAGSGASGSAIPFAAEQNVYADGQLDEVAVFGESTSDLTGAYSAKCGRFRHIATGTGLTVDHETYGLIGQMCVKGTTLTHMHGGLMGTFEGTGASVVLNSSRFATGSHAAVIARVGGASNITATTPLAGFLAFNNNTAAIASGTYSAFAVAVNSTSYPWGYGLNIPSGSTTVGIYIGNTVGNSITISNGTIASGDSYSGLRVSVANGDTDISNEYGIAGYFESTLNANTGTDNTGHLYNLGSWINFGTGYTPAAGKIHVPFEGGIYDGGGTLTNARIVFGGQHQAILSSSPNTLHAWRLNTSTYAVTALIAAASPQSVGYVAGAGTSGVQVGYIPIADIVGPGVVYIRVYSSAT